MEVQGITAEMDISDTDAAKVFAIRRDSEVKERLQNADGCQLSSDNMGFFVDTVGSGSLIPTGLPRPTVRSPSSMTESDSEDEVIVFLGRKDRKKGTPEPVAVTKRAMPRVVEDGVASQPPNATASAVQAIPNRSKVLMVLNASQNGKLQAEGQKCSTERERYSNKVRKNDEILADYIANLQANDSANDTEGFPHPRQRDLGLNVWERECLVRADQDVRLQNSNEEWDSENLQDFDGFSTSSEMMDTTPRILAKRLRNSAIQYLVTRKGEPVDDARWLPPALLKATDAADVIAYFEDQDQAEHARLTDDDVSEGSSSFESLLGNDLAEDMKSLADEKDLDDRRKARMSDEQIARLLSKQADLGIMGDELVLYNGDGLATASGSDRRAGLYGTSSAITSRYSLEFKPQKKKKRFNSSFPPATLFADILEQDPYNGFDVIDRERPSLRKKAKKAGRAKAIFDVSDSDLQQSLHSAWENDRSKKKQRKLEREERRAQGLLNKNGKPDLKAKFSEGMTMDDVRSQIKAFMKASAESQPLPPMGYDERKAVHDFANKHGLKSKSVGNGNARFPVLYKTLRTKALDPNLESRIDAIFTPTRFLPRLDKTRRRVAPPMRARNGGSKSATASYRDGEVVGVGAPELGIENKGRAMLEKMGWSTGTTLGAVENKGIAHPIAQTVKTSKAGLG